MAQHAAKRLFEVARREDCLSGTVRQNRALDQHRAVAKFGHRTQIVGRDQHDAALGAQVAQKADDLVLGLDVDAGERLVKQDDLAVLGERAGEEDTLFLAAGQFADLALAEGGHANPFERLVDHFPVGRRRPSQKAHMAIATHHDDVFDQNGEGPVDLLGLRHIGDDVAVKGFGDAHAEHGDVTARRGHEAHDRLEEGGFARAVDADQRGDGAARDFEAGVAQGGVAVAVGDRDVTGGKARVGFGFDRRFHALRIEHVHCPFRRKMCGSSLHMTACAANRACRDFNAPPKRAARAAIS